MRSVAKICIFWGLLLCAGESLATHLRAAEIITNRIDLTTYEISLIVYTDAESVTDGSGNLEFSEADIRINNNTVQVLRDSVSFLGNDTYVNVFNTVFTFPSVNTGYRISYLGINRNGGIENVQNPSDQVQMYVETFVFVDATSTENTSPILTVPPIDLAAGGQVYTHNPGAFDVDGDSISFEFVVPRTSANAAVPLYTPLDAPQFGNATFEMDPFTGNIIWDVPPKPASPSEVDEYNIAIRINEFRNGVRIGYVIRDMQILVFDSDNNPPILELPPDTCSVATVPFEAEILAYDPDGDDITLTQFAGYSGLGDELSFPLLLNDSLLAQTSWVPTCEDVRNQPYNTVYRVVDDHPVSLSALDSYGLTVHAPAPEGLVTEATPDGIQLRWQEYPCQGNNVDAIQVYRRDCDTGAVVRDFCAPVLPDEWGYELIASLPLGDTSYFDNAADGVLVPGQDYCYALAVIFNSPGGGQSFVSDISCTGLVVNVPLLTNVSAVVLDSLEGDILLRWNEPLELPGNGANANWAFDVYRGAGLFGEPDQFVGRVTGALSEPQSFVDSSIPTYDTSYVYRIDVIDPDGVAWGSSPVVSSVELQGLGASESAVLSWETNGNWFYPDSLFHLIYTFDETDTSLVDSIPADILGYTVENLVNGDTFCYYVETRSVFCNDSITEVFSNFSNAVCVIPVDTLPPCPPILSIQLNDCENFVPQDVITNEMSWVNVSQGEDCDSLKIAHYIVYDSPTGQSSDGFQPLDTVLAEEGTFYSHDSLSSYVRCYRVRAEDEFGNVSGFSNVVCNDNCEYFELPNIFTPNGDDRNDRLFPIPTPRFVEDVEFFVYNRWGKLVHYSNEDPNINWDGADAEGNRVADGLYFYLARVSFEKLDPGSSSTEFKGWVMISR